jgi:diaminopimelate epimerase
MSSLAGPLEEKPMIFYKTVTCGNDFIHVDMKEYESCGGLVLTKGELAKQLCCQHSGPGADGVVYYRTHPNGQPADFEIFNKDGSEAELSGNGMAGCSALLLYIDSTPSPDQVNLRTKTGLKTHTCLYREKNRFRLKVEIGKADFRNRDFFPFLEEQQLGYSFRDLVFYPVSVGNPHAVVVPEKDLPDRELEQVGRMLAAAGLFPHQVNVEFLLPQRGGSVNYEEGKGFRVIYYERGVGPTLSSSTGSAAVFAVLKALRRITGSLTIPCAGENIKISEKNKIYIESYSKIVYKGIYLTT